MFVNFQKKPCNNHILLIKQTVCVKGVEGGGLQYSLDAMVVVNKN